MGRAVFGCIAVVMLSAGLPAAADYEYAPSDGAALKHTVEQSLRFIENLLHGVHGCQLRFPTAVGGGRGFGTGVRLLPDFIEFPAKTGEPYRIPFSKMPKIKMRYVSYLTDPDDIFVELNPPPNFFRFECTKISSQSHILGERGKIVAEHFRRLQIAYEERNNPSEEAHFEEAAARYLAANPKPDLSEEARRFKVQAEAAIRDQRFADAEDRFAKALRLVPWWPEGRFNRALVLGELKSYEEAIREMQRYLRLSPQAPDTRAAKDKIYEWEDAVGRK